MSNRWQVGLSAVIIIYAICHFLLFFIQGVYWDDFVIWNAPVQEYSTMSQNCNNYLVELFLNFVVGNFSPGTQITVFRLSSFFCGLISTVAVWFILKLILKNFSAVLFASLLFASCSINRCEILICCSHYTFSNMFFYLGLLLLVNDYYRDRITLRIVASIVWLLTLLLWRSAILLIPVCVILVSACGVNFKWNAISSYWEVIKVSVKKYWMMILVCVIYAVLYLTVLHPQGEYSTYYSLQPKNALLSPLTATMTSIHVVFTYLAELAKAFAFGDSMLSVLPILLAVMLFICLKQEYAQIKGVKEVFVLSCIFLVFAILPQMLIKRVIYSISIQTLASRIASLSLLPISMIITCALTQCSVKFQRILMSILLSSAIFYSFSVYVDHSRGWAKNDAIAAFFAQHQELNGKKLHIEDRTSGINAFPGDPMRTYEYEGVARLAYGQNSQTKVETNCFASLVPGFIPEVFIEIDNGEILFNDYMLFIYRYVNKGLYDRAVEKLIQIRITNK